MHCRASLGGRPGWACSCTRGSVGLSSSVETMREQIAHSGAGPSTELSPERVTRLRSPVDVIYFMPPYTSSTPFPTATLASSPPPLLGANMAHGGFGSPPLRAVANPKLYGVLSWSDLSRLVISQPSPTIGMAHSV